MAGLLAHADLWAEGGSLLLGLAVGAGTRDAMSVADVRPLSRGEPISAAELLYAGGQWQAGVGYQIGGTWFDFSQPFGVSGNIKDQRWLIRARVDRRWALSGSTAVTLGLSGEYGEARSWTDTRFVTEEGPRTFMTGGSIRAGLGHFVASRLEVFGEIETSIFHAHATHGAVSGDYNWIGRGAAMMLGARLLLIRGKAS